MNIKNFKAYALLMLIIIGGCGSAVFASDIGTILEQTEGRGSLEKFVAGTEKLLKEGAKKIRTPQGHKEQFVNDQIIELLKQIQKGDPQVVYALDKNGNISIPKLEFLLGLLRSFGTDAATRATQYENAVKNSVAIQQGAELIANEAEKLEKSAKKFVEKVQTGSFKKQGGEANAYTKLLAQAKEFKTKFIKNKNRWYTLYQTKINTAMQPAFTAHELYKNVETRSIHRFVQNYLNKEVEKLEQMVVNAENYKESRATYDSLVTLISNLRKIYRENDSKPQGEQLAPETRKKLVETEDRLSIVLVKIQEHEKKINDLAREIKDSKFNTTTERQKVQTKIDQLAEIDPDKALELKLDTILTKQSSKKPEKEGYFVPTVVKPGKSFSGSFTTYVNEQKNNVIWLQKNLKSKLSTSKKHEFENALRDVRAELAQSIAKQVATDTKSVVATLEARTKELKKWKALPAKEKVDRILSTGEWIGHIGRRLREIGERGTSAISNRQKYLKNEITNKIKKPLEELVKKAKTAVDAAKLETNDTLLNYASTGTKTSLDDVTGKLKTALGALITAANGYKNSLRATGGVTQANVDQVKGFITQYYTDEMSPESADAIIIEFLKGLSKELSDDEELWLK